MNKLTKIVSLVLFLGFIFLYYKTSEVKSAASDSQYAWQMTEITASSAVVFKGPGYAKALYVTTGTSASTDDGFAILIDTPNVTAGSTYASYSSGRKKSPPLLFLSTASACNSSWVAPDTGVFISSAATVFKTNENSGEARKAYLLWRR